MPVAKMRAAGENVGFWGRQKQESLRKNACKSVGKLRKSAFVEGIQVPRAIIFEIFRLRRVKKCNFPKGSSPPQADISGIFRLRRAGGGHPTHSSDAGQDQWGGSEVTKPILWGGVTIMTVTSPHPITISKTNGGEVRCFSRVSQGWRHASGTPAARIVAPWTPRCAPQAPKNHSTWSFSAFSSLRRCLDATLPCGGFC